MKKFLYILFLIFFVKADICQALEIETHRLINETIINRDYGVSLNNYLINSLKMPLGINTVLNQKPIYKIFGDAGKLEDTAGINYLRSTNHFHDPLVTNWWDAGFKGKQSSIIWAQSESQFFDNYSWRNGRDYFYNALIADNEKQRENNLADTFRAVGQVMHLIEDASVPAHVRNDSHMWGYHYEKYVDYRRAQNENQFFLDFLLSYYRFSDSILKEAPNSQAPIPIAKIVDTDKYTGDNPEITAGFDVGLSEYVNANFFSEGSAMDYKNPALSNLQEELMLVHDTNYPDDPTKKMFMKYYRKVGGGETVDHLAAVSYMSYLHSKYELQNYYNKIIFLDDNCYEDYAYKLIPRATGYAAGLLQYFFRGQIDAIDAKTTKETGNSGNSVITGMTLKVKNNTPGEEMTATGSSHLVVAYNYKDGNGNTVYGKSGDVVLTFLKGIPYNNSTSDDTYKYSFNFSPAIPADAKDKQYMLVYRGKLGQEDDAVAGKSFKPQGRNYLFIKQRNYKLHDVSRKTCSSWSAEFLASDFSFIAGNCNGLWGGDEGWHNVNVDFDLSWLNEPMKITKVEIKYLNRWNNTQAITESTYNLTQPTVGNPSGYLHIEFKLPDKETDYWSWFSDGGPKVSITAVGADSKEEVYEEYVAFSYMHQTREIWDFYNTNHIFFRTMVYKGTSFDVSNPVLPLLPYYYFYDKKTGNSERIWSGFNDGITLTYYRAWATHNKYNYQTMLPHLEFFPYSKRTLTLKRKWDYDKLAGEGYDVNKFEQWEVPVEIYWVQ